MKSLITLLVTVILTTETFTQTTIANFSYEITQEEENQDERFGSDNEVEIILKIDNQIVDSFSEYGELVLNDSKTVVDLTSELMEKHYEIVSKSPTKVIIKKNSFCSDCKKQETNKLIIYQKNSHGDWKFLSCSGDCTD